jgi:uncharacterized protein (DUF1697 family)
LISSLRIKIGSRSDPAASQERKGGGKLRQNCGVSTYIAFLRGVNVGGNKKLKMDALKSLCDSLGFSGAKTYLQSGNVVFKTDEKKPAATLEAALEKKLTLQSRVIVRTAAELKKIIARNPFDVAQRNPSRLLVVFLDGKPAAKAKDALLAACGPHDELQMSGEEIYLYCGDGISQTKVFLLLNEKTLGVTSTARNWNTVTKLLEVAEEVSS